MSDDYERTPQNLDAERAVLGAVLVDSDVALAKIGDDLGPEDFYRKSHGDIYAAALSLQRQRQPIDLVTISDELERAGHLNSVGGSVYLTGLMLDVPTASHAKHYADIVRATARSRRLIAIAGKIAAAAYEETDPGEAEARAVGLLLEATARNSNGMRLLTPEQQADMLVSLLEARSTGQHMGVPTGFLEFDRVTSGLRRGDLVLIGARPSTGKSALAETIGEQAARAGKVVAFVSIEMDAEQVLFRFASRAGGLSSLTLASGLRSEDEWSALYQLAEDRANLPLYLFDSPKVTTHSIQAALSRLSMTIGAPLDLVIIDYLQLIKPTTTKGRSREQEVAEISRDLKIMARELRVPMIVLSQLNREVEGRGDPEPKLSDLRDSGALEQDADVVLFLWRDESENVHAKIAKQRNGPIGNLVNLRFDKRTFRFYEVAA